MSSELTNSLQQQQKQSESIPQQQQLKVVDPLDEFEAMKAIGLPAESRFKWCGCPKSVTECKCDSNYNGE